MPAAGDWFPSLFTSVCEQRNVQAVAYLQNSSLVTFPDDMLTQLLQEILLAAETYLGFKSLAHSPSVLNHPNTFFFKHLRWNL